LIPLRRLGWQVHGWAQKLVVNFHLAGVGQTVKPFQCLFACEVAEFLAALLVLLNGYSFSALVPSGLQNFTASCFAFSS
jgi:hypothetical protein